MPNHVKPGETGEAPVGGGSRQLWGLEYAMCLTDEVEPFSVVSVLRLDGALPAATLRAALDDVQRRHPLLRATIVKEGGGYAYHFDAAGPIPLDVCERTGPDHWIAATQDELHARFDYVAGPLMRCRYLLDPRGGDLIISMPHNIVDAVSATSLFRELLALCAGQAPDDAGDNGGEGRTPASALYPKAYTGLGMVRATAAYMGSQMADEISFRWNSRGGRTPPIAKTARQEILPIRFSPSLTDAIVQASRRRRVTLNAILSAAMVSAVQRRLYPSPRVPLRHIIFNDLRSRLTRTLPPTMLGCYLSMFRLTVMVEPDKGFWPLAEQIQASTTRAAHSGERYLAYAMIPGLMKMIFRTKAFRMGATAFSYAGPIDLRTSSQAFEVTGVHSFAANMTLGPEYSALVRLFRGELCWDILYLDSDMDAATARQIADDMRTLVEEATC
ncbi:MAG: condensation domain-containing protein [Acidobacteriota bacterium]